MKTLVIKSVVIALISVLADISVYSQGAQPQVPDQVRNLMKFVGKWQADASFVTEGKTYKMAYRVVCNKTAEGNGILADLDISNAELGSIKASDLAGFDPYTSKIKWFTVDNMGTSHEHTGEWITPEHLTIQHEGVRDGKKYVEKIDFSFINESTMNFKLTGTLDGKETERAEAVFHKVPAVSGN